MSTSRWPCLLWLALSSSCAAGDEDASEDYVLYDDIQVPAARHYRGMGNGGFTGEGLSSSKLWPNGRVNYYVDTEGTNPRSKASYSLSASDRRISGAVQHWEQKTCIRFNRCTSESSCPRPYIRFQSSASGCNSPVGVAFRVNQINLASSCSTGTTIHEIGHSIGLGHEHNRNDRDDHVTVVTSNIREGMGYAFKKTGSQGRALGPYDYASVMHYSPYAFRRRGAGKTIEAPYNIGRRSGLSAGDVSAVHFMYNECKRTFEAPRCVASVSQTSTITVARGTAFRVEFNGLYSDALVVSYADTSRTVSPSAIRYSVSEGGYIGRAGRTNIEFTPGMYEQGRTHTIAARFVAGSGSRQVSQVCFVTVKVPGVPIPITMPPPTPAPTLPAGYRTLSMKDDDGASIVAQYGNVDDGYYPQYEGRQNHVLTVRGVDCKLTWNTFDVERSSFCRYDSVRIETAGRRYAKLCGSTVPDTLELSGSWFKVTFTTDSSGHKAGFDFDFACRAPGTDETPAPAPQTSAPRPATRAPATPVPTTARPATPVPTTAVPAGECADRRTDAGGVWHLSYGSNFDCAYFDDTTGYRCGKFGVDSYRHMGLTGQEACCVCGGGVRGTAASTPAPATRVPATPVSETPSPPSPAPATSAPQTDIPLTPVPETPSPPSPAPATPVPPTPAPSTPIPTAASTPLPTETPVTEPPVTEPPTTAPTTGECVDVTVDGAPWHLSYGGQYGCEYFAERDYRCERFGGEKYRHMGFTGQEACCVCGGGM